MPAMEETKLKAILEAERTNAAGDSLGTSTSDLTKQRAEAMDFYQGDIGKYMPVAEGRSSAVSTDVADTVDSIMPDLMDIFMGSDEVVKFNPVGPEDVEQAEQETDFINRTFFVDNEGFTVLHSWMKDALIQKNGIVKYWWDEGDEEERETYTSLTDDGFAFLVAEDSIELIEHTETPGTDENGQPTILHDATVITRKPFGKAKVMAVPPEEFLIATDARDIQTSRYCAHTLRKTRSELIDEGYDKKQVDDLPANSEVLGEETEARATVDDNDDQTAGADVNKAMQKIEVTEHYVKVDFDGDGIAELRKVTTAGTGNDILKWSKSKDVPADKRGELDNEPYDRMPFAGITPILMSHRFWGRALADLVIQIQSINTALIRVLLDNLYYMNSQRLEIAESHAGDYTMEDALTQRPGAPIRTAKPGGVNPIPVTSVVQHVLPVIEHMNTVRETRTGAPRFNGGPGAASNPFNETLGGAEIVVSAGQKRIRLIARTFAEVGFKDLFVGLHELVLKHGKDARQVLLGNKWVTVDPRTWKTRKDMTVSIGLGTGTREQMAAQLQRILGFQIQALQMQGGATGPIVNLENVHHTLKKFTENAGFRDSESFFVEPPEEGQQPQKQEKPDPAMAKVQGELQIKGAKLQGDQKLDQAKLAVDQQHNVASLEAKRQEAVLDAQIAMFKEQLEADTDLRIAGIKSELEAEIAEMRAQLETAIAIRGQNVDADAKVRAGGQIG